MSDFSRRGVFLLGAASGAFLGTAATVGIIAYLNAKREHAPSSSQTSVLRSITHILSPVPLSSTTCTESSCNGKRYSHLEATSSPGDANGNASTHQASSSHSSSSPSSVFDTSAVEEREQCPGVASEGAGKAEACEGCPNRSLCSSGAAAGAIAAQTLAASEVAQRLKNVKRKVMILSGKGGVGKSSVTSQIAWTIASRGLSVGICDVDVCGPSIPLMMNVVHGEVHQSASGWEPVYVRDNLAVMSIGFLLPDTDAAVVWRGPKKNGLIHQFFADVRWGDLDLLLIDTPPGTSDEHLSLVSLLKTDGAVIVTTPQEAALQDVRKEINFCKKVDVKVLGVVENMVSSVFASVNPDGAKTMCKQMEVPYSGSIPLDPSLLRSCEAGVAVVEEYPEAPASAALEKLVTDLLTLLELPLYGDENTFA